MEMLLDDDDIIITSVKDHYEAYLHGEFVVSGDTWNEVYNEIKEMRYLR